MNGCCLRSLTSQDGPRIRYYPCTSANRIETADSCRQDRNDGEIRAARKSVDLAELRFRALRLMPSSPRTSKAQAGDPSGRAVWR
jgi:hypothetical protein